MIEKSRAYKYAQFCVAENSGKVGKYVKKQCRVWLDIADGKYPDCYISEKKYKKVKGIMKLMVHPDLNVDMYHGLDDYAMLFVVAVLCTYKNDGSRKYSVGLLEIARKNFKTFTSAVIFIILSLTEPRFSRLFSVAPTYKLSSELRLAVRRIIKSSPTLEKHYKITKDMVTCRLTDIEYTPLAYSNDKLDGRLANAFLADEDGAMDSYPVAAMFSSQITLKSSLGIIISTQYPNDNNDMTIRIDMAKKILDNIYEKDNMFSLLYEPDDEIINQWETDENVLYQSNPVILDKPKMMENLLEKREEAIMYEDMKENFLCKHCNIQYRGVGSETYIPIDKVQLCRIEQNDSFWNGKRVYLGLDLSLSDDNTAVAMVTIVEGVVYARIMGFIPKDAVDRKTTKEKFDYEKSIKNRECIACGDDVISYGVVEDYILGLEHNLGVEVVCCAYDKWNANSTIQRLEGADEPIQCAGVGQHSKFLAPATKLLKEKVLSGEFRYEDSKLLENNFSNARCVLDTNLNQYVNKKKSSGKVDMVVATINAFYLLIEYEMLNKEVECYI